MWYINTIIILSGVCILIGSFLVITRIVAELKLGGIKKRWIILRVFLVVFIAGYMSYWLLVAPSSGAEGLIVGGVFFLGAIFTLIVSWLMLQTTRVVGKVPTLELETITDPLLNIYNRRYLDQRLEEEVARMKRYKLPLSLILLDIDHFKSINDRYGHMTGDTVLRNIGEVLLAQIRKSDLAARYGGEEMAILLPNTGEKEAYNMAERIRTLIEHKSFADVGIRKGVCCTISLGVSSAQDENCSGADLFNQADAAMYHAKKTGRNRTVAYSQEFEDDPVQCPLK